MMVPVFYDLQRRQTKVWVFLGWTARTLRVTYRKRPRFVVRDLKGRDVTEQVDVERGALSVPLCTPVTAEMYVSKLLDREEFPRALRPVRLRGDDPEGPELIDDAHLIVRCRPTSRSATQRQRKAQRRATSRIVPSLRTVTTAPRFRFGTVWTWSRLTAQWRGIPLDSSSTTWVVGDRHNAR